MRSIEDIIISHLNDETSSDEVERLFAWVGEKTENADEFARCALLHAQLRRQFFGERQMSESAGLPVVRSHAPRQTRSSRVTWSLVGASLATCVLIAIGVTIWWSTNAKPDDRMILLHPLAHAGEVTPFELEAAADVVAIAAVGQPQARGGESIVGIELVEVLKGETLVESLQAEPESARLACIVPDNPSARRAYAPGERVAVYLKHVGEDWFATQVIHLSPEQEAKWRDRVEPFLHVLLASEADNPRQRYAELLVARAKDGQSTAPKTKSDRRAAQGTPRLSEASYFALKFNPDPRAGDALRGMLSSALGNKRSKKQAVASDQTPIDGVRKQLGGGGAGGINKSQNPMPAHQKAQAHQGSSFTDSPLDLVVLLASMHDSKSIPIVLDYISQLAEHERRPFIEQLPELCRHADAEMLQIVERDLDRLAQQHPSGRQDASSRSLKDVRNAIESLRKE